MGFRLEIRADNENRAWDIEKDFYGTKFFSYYDGWRDSNSAFFLQMLYTEAILDDIDFTYSTDDYELTAKEFKIFVSLYESDFHERFNVPNVLTRHDVIRKMLETDTPKVLSWN